MSQPETRTHTQTAPVSGSERIVALDVLRGFAVLGILVMNIQSFSMIAAAYFNPAANDKAEGAGFAVWTATHLFFDLKFMAIFSMLFGAGIVLMTGRAEEPGAKLAGLHYGRQFWLLLIGLAHAHLIWYGDILVPYALCAFLLFFLRRSAPRKLLVIGIILMLVPLTLFAFAGWSVQYWPENQLTNQANEWAPPDEAAAAEIEAYRGGWLDQLPQRSLEALGLETFAFFFFLGWRIAGMMLIGMALFKLGVFSAERTPAFYRRMALVGFGLGLPIITAGIAFNMNADFASERSMFHGALFNYVGSMGMSLGYVAVLMLAVQRSWLARLQRRLAATGRMALTNYITQSLICTFIFYGHGLGLFETVGRPAQLLIVLGVLAAQLLWSPWWLDRFRFGPLEWLWRSLTYRSLQPMRRPGSQAQSRRPLA